MLNKLKKIKKLLVSALFLCAFFFALTFTPLSNILASGLANQFKYNFNYNFAKEKPDIYDTDFNKTLLNLSFPGIKNIYNYNNFINTLETPIENNLEILEKNYNPYENMPLKDDEPILTVYDLYAYYQAASGAQIEDAENSAEDIIIPEDYYKITPKNYSGQKTKVPKLLISNETSFSISNIDLEDYIKKKYPISASANKFDPEQNNNSDNNPIILILNTHTTESYVEDGTEYYSPPFTGERTADLNKNVALIATQLKQKLEEYNIPVIQSIKLHDAVSYKDSYLRSLETMNEYLEKYPSIKYIIDVHRDSMIAADGEKFKPAIKINGKDCAQIMMVIGTSDGGAYHPNWQENLTFAAYLQQKTNDKYPMLARPINLRSARFNQHTTTGSIILEVGSCGSTFSEALYAADLFGECLAELILENN